MVALPFECGLQTIQYVMTLGATSFLAFIYANIVELAVMVLMRVAVKPMQFKLQVASYPPLPLASTFEPVRQLCVSLVSSARAEIQSITAECCASGLASSSEHARA